MRLKRWRNTAAAMTMAAAAVPATARESECAVETRLYWIDVSALAPFAYGAMAAEVAGSLADHGVCADVARLAPSAVRTSEGIGVILLGSMGPAGAGRRVMGATRRGAASVASVWVYFDEVSAALALGGRDPAAWSAVERAEFGRALGRVAAHEIIHALLPGRPHDRAGLMAATLGRDELTGSTLHADPELRAALRRGGAASLAVNRSWAAAK